MAVHYPAWVAAGALKLAVNGKDVPAMAGPDGYAEVAREWKDGDVLEAELPMRLTTEALPRCANYLAVLYGPLVLAGKLGRDGLSDDDFRGQFVDDKKALPPSGRQSLPHWRGRLSIGSSRSRGSRSRSAPTVWPSPTTLRWSPFSSSTTSATPFTGGWNAPPQRRSRREESEFRRASVKRPGGAPLRTPLDTMAAAAWMGYASPGPRRRMWPALR